MKSEIELDTFTIICYLYVCVISIGSTTTPANLMVSDSFHRRLQI